MALLFYFHYLLSALKPLPLLRPFTKHFPLTINFPMNNKAPTFPSLSPTPFERGNSRFSFYIFYQVPSALKCAVGTPPLEDVFFYQCSSVFPLPPLPNTKDTFLCLLNTPPASTIKLSLPSLQMPISRFDINLAVKCHFVKETPQLSWLHHLQDMVSGPTRS